MATSETIVSAPGKVLLAGGYLVLDRAYTGLVLGTSSRFYCSVLGTAAAGDAPSVSDTARITVRAGQFPADASTWEFDVNVTPGTDAPALVQTNADTVGKNKFVEITLAKVLQYALERLVADGGREPHKALLRLLSAGGGGLNVVVLADNDFYSQREQLAAASLEPRLASLAKLAPFCPLPRPITKTNKTGLGSSAALVTSIVAALLAHFDLCDIDSAAGQRTVHNLGQAAHCVAQGKVGSGFDVASAVYGTHVYRRFSPAVLEPLFAPEAKPSLLRCVEQGNWDQTTAPLRLPRGLRLLLADVDAGTDTPSFVGKVLAWRKAEPQEALGLWTKLDEANRSLGTQLAGLRELEGSNEFDAALAEAANGTFEKAGDGTGSPVASALQAIRFSINDIRRGMRSMSAASGVPIEPPEQTRLLDACSACAGVLGGGVPGAGGYDAIWVLAVDDPAVVSRVEGIWSSWTEMSVCPLASSQSDGGLKREQASAIAGLASTLAKARASGNSTAQPRA